MRAGVASHQPHIRGWHAERNVAITGGKENPLGLLVVAPG